MAKMVCGMFHTSDKFVGIYNALDSISQCDVHDYTVYGWEVFKEDELQNGDGGNSVDGDDRESKGE